MSQFPQKKKKKKVGEGDWHNTLNLKLVVIEIAQQV